MNKKVIDFRLFGIVFVLGAALLIGGCSGSANNQKSDGKADKRDTEVVKDELQVNAEQREESNKKFKQADKVLQHYIIARFEGDVDTLESMYIPNGKGYENFEKSGKNQISLHGQENFSENVSEFSYIRYSSEYDKTGKLYYRTYVFGKGGEDSLKASTSVNVALVKNEEGEWKVEEDGTVSTIFPRTIEKDGGTVSELHFDNNGNLIE